MKPLLPSISKPPSSLVLEPSTAKPTRGKLRARLEVLAKKKRSVKRKPEASPEGCPPSWGKDLKARASSSPSSAVGVGGTSEGGGGGALSPPWRFFLFGLESQVAGWRALSCNAGQSEEGLLWCCRERGLYAFSCIARRWGCFLYPSRFRPQEGGRPVRRGSSSSSASGDHLCTSKRPH